MGASSGIEKKEPGGDARRGAAEWSGEERTPGNPPFPEELGRGTCTASQTREVAPPCLTTVSSGPDSQHADFIIM